MLSKTLLVIPLLEKRQPNLESSKDFLNCLSVNLKRTFIEKNLFLERSIVTKIKYPQSAFCKKWLVFLFFVKRPEVSRKITFLNYRCQLLKLNHLSAFRKNNPVVFYYSWTHEKILEVSRKSSSFTSRERFFGMGCPHFQQMIKNQMADTWTSSFVVTYTPISVNVQRKSLDRTLPHWCLSQTS